MMRSSQCFLVLLLLLITFHGICYSNEKLMENYPTPNTKNNRIMGMLLAFNNYHIDPVLIILNEYVSMCEGGWQPTVVFFTTVHWSPTMFRFFRQKAYCYRTQSPIDIRTSEHDSSINIGLGAQHRIYMQKELDNYDVFIYHEDDILFKHSHLAGYLHETKRLHNLFPDTGLYEYCIGFQRYRKIYRNNDIHESFAEQDILEMEFFEETPTFVPTCLKEEPYIRVDGNIHQAIWILTQQQVRMLVDKCNFLNMSSPSREFMSSFSLFDHKPHYCALTKVLPADRLMTFMIHHYYPQRHVSWKPVFQADENIRAGFDPYSSPRYAANVPSCWKDIVNNYGAEQADDHHHH